MKIGNREIDYDRPPAFVAEISCNHMGELLNAITLVSQAKRAGADFVKFQCYEPQAMTLPGKFPIKEGPWAGRDLYELYQEAQTPYRWFPLLAQYCELNGMPWFASVFDMEGIVTLEAAGCPAYKIASCEIADVHLIHNAALTGKPVIISTGMASREDIRRAYETVRHHSPHEPILLHCIAGYPSKIEEAQLRTIEVFRRDYGFVGLSDHTPGSAVPVAATILGAVMIEKHLMLPHKYWSDEWGTAGKSLDCDFSLLEEEFKQMVEQCTSIWHALHSDTLRIDTAPTGSETETVWARRSLHALTDIDKGEAFTRHNVGAIRPSGGIVPWRLNDILGRAATRALQAGDPITEIDLFRS
jgi:sialic acid synthase SpsE